MVMRYRASVAAALVVLTPLSALAADLPVRQVVLYKNGVGYFERGGDLRPGESARLDFKASEMNDVLKSLSIVQKGGGPVTGIRYDSAEPLQTKLNEFPFRIDAGQPLSAFLDQLRGARLDLKMLAGDSAAGVIVSARRLAGDAQKNERELLLLLTDSGEIKTYDLSLMASLKFADATLELELKRFLSTLTAARSKEKKSIYLDSSNDQARNLGVTYMIPMPVWKSSYRLIFGATGDPMLEGWAVVDNTTGEDWTNVSLALVSGRPVSFISRMYEPRYVQRQVADLAEAGVVGPQTHAAAMAKQMPMPPPPPAPGVVGGVAADQMRYRASREEMKVTASMPSIQTEASTISVSTEARELGDLFEYRFSTPVTVRKNESAMVPFLQQKVATRKLLIWREGSDLANPLSAAEITNTSGKTLDGGPITVFDASTYAGEALMETLKNADKRLISYAVDLGTRVTTNLETTRETVREIKAKNGILTTKSAVQETTTYTIKNVDAKAKTLILEHPIEAGETLVGTNRTPAEKTATHYRFSVPVAASAEQKFLVQTERIEEQTMQISSWAPDQILVYVKNQKLSEAAKRGLESLAAKKNQVEENAAAIRRTETEINELVRDQDRLRQNLTALNRVQGQEAQVRKYSTDLAASETKLAGLRDTLAEQRRRDTTLRAELAGLIDRLEF